MPPHLANEKIVLDQARAGDSTAFEALIGPYHHRLYRRALKIMRNKQDAEDVIQDAELKAYCRLDRFQGSSRFYTWVTRIVINEALMKLRRRRSYRETESLEPLRVGKQPLDLRRTSSPDEQPETHYLGVELRSILSGALAVLSPSLSAPFLLCFLEGYSLREIAALLGLSVPAIKSRLHRARNILSKRLRGMLQPPYPTPRSEA